MFYHSKELQFNAGVSKPDPKFARILLEQFGGSNGELKAAMQYFTQAFTCRQPYPDQYDLLMDIATEEFSHLEIVGATIQMLLSGVGGELKDSADSSELSSLLEGVDAKQSYMHEALCNPQFCVLSGGGPTLTDSNGNPWSGTYVSANGDLTVDLRSNIGAESRAKIVYEYLLKFTEDSYVKETLQFLMTREVAHMQMFEASLASLKPNFPPGSRQGYARFTNLYFNMSEKEDGTEKPWNSGKSPDLNEKWQYVDDPKSFVSASNGLINVTADSSEQSQEDLDQTGKKLGNEKKALFAKSVPTGENQWSEYSQASYHSDSKKKRAMKNKIFKMIIAMSVTALLCDCSNRNTPQGLSAQDKAFMDSISFINLAEVQAGNIAVALANTPQVKSYGRMLLSDHQKAQQLLMAMAEKRLSYTLPDHTDNMHAHMLDTIKGSHPIDSAFIYHMIAGHNKAISLLQRESDMGKDDSLIDYARDNLSIVVHHRMMADSLAHTLFPRR